MYLKLLSELNAVGISDAKDKISINEIGQPLGDLLKTYYVVKK